MSMKKTRSFRLSQLVIVALFGSATATFADDVPPNPTLRSTQFPPVQRRILEAIGDRLQKPGKEALTISANLDSFSAGRRVRSSAVTLIWQYPGLLRLDDSGASVVFDGTAVTKRGNALSQQDSDLVESVVKDSPEGFLLGRFTGSRVQLIGEHYNIKDPRQGSPLVGQCTLLSVSEVNGVHGPNSKIEKTYCFDSATSLLKAVFYRDQNDAVETRYSGWQTVSGQVLPSTVQRFRNNLPVLTLTFTQVTISGKVSASVFQLP